MAGRARYGKTETAINQFLHLVRSRHGGLFLDPHEDALQRIKAHLTEPELAERIIEINLAGGQRELRSTNLLERSLEEVKRRTKVIGRFPGETSCLSLCWAVLDLFIASARGLALTALEHRQLAQMRAARTAGTPASLTA